MVSSTTPTATITPLTVQSPWAGNTISGTIKMNNPLMMNGVLDTGFLFASHGGMIVNAIDAGSLMGKGGAYSLPNVPGGTPANPLPLVFYGVEAVGWQASLPRLRKAIAVPAITDLRPGNDTGVDLNMLPLW